MIKRTGNLFDTAAFDLAHGVNCKGVMGSGIAVEVKNRFPGVFEDYRLHCHQGMMHVGTDFWVEDTDLITGENHRVHNVASQYHTGRDAREPWLFSSLTAAANDVYSNGRGVLAIPFIGCGIGGLDLPVLINVIGVIESLIPIEFEVWKFA